MGEIQITIDRKRALQAASVAAGVLVALAACELGARLLLPASPAHDRVELCDRSRRASANCYPAAGAVELPYDLRRQADAAAFAGEFPFLQLCSRAHADHDGDLRPFAEGLPARGGGLERLAEIAPLCVTYDNAPFGRRGLVAPRGYRGTIALLGDSFVFGQGVAESDTLTRKLAERLGERVFSYAYMGADLAEVRRQLEQALIDAPGNSYRRIVYVFVLNDPYRARALDERLERLNDLMNVRRRGWFADSGGVVGLLSPLLARSRLVDQLLYRHALGSVARRTISWYSDLLDPARNPRLIETMDAIAEMSRKAAARRVGFDLVIYPMMAGFEAYPFKTAHATLVRLAAERGIPTLDLLTAFEHHAGERLVVHPIDYHPNARAHEIAAAALAEYLEKSARPKAKASGG